MEKESDALYALLKENDEKTSSLRDDLDKAKEEYNNHVNNIKLFNVILAKEIIKCHTCEYFAIIKQNKAIYM